MVTSDHNDHSRVLFVVSRGRVASARVFVGRLGLVKQRILDAFLNVARIRVDPVFEEWEHVHIEGVILVRLDRADKACALGAVANVRKVIPVLEDRPAHPMGPVLFSIMRGVPDRDTGHRKDDRTTILVYPLFFTMMPRTRGGFFFGSRQGCSSSSSMLEITCFLTLP